MNKEEKYVLALIIIVFALLILSFLLVFKSRQEAENYLEPCKELMNEARSRCDYTIKVKVDDFIWDCNDEEVYSKMIIRDRNGVFCVEENIYTEPGETALTYTCELDDGKLIWQQKMLEINGNNCVEILRKYYASH